MAVSMATLANHHIAVLITDGFEEVELREPLRALRTEGGLVDIIAPYAGPLQGLNHQLTATTLQPDRILSDTVRAEQYDALLLPGGALSADGLRRDPRIQKFVSQMDEAEKPIAAVSHAPWILISAGVVSGRRVTSYPTLQDDLRNAGAHWLDKEIVVDDNLLTGRSTADLGAFNNAMIALFSEKPPLISAGTRHVFSRSRIA
jgi:protease I